MMRLFLVLTLVMCSACSDGDPARSTARGIPPDPAPQDASDPAAMVRQDAAALVLLDRADGLLYSPLVAGLADVTYRYKSSRQPKVVVEVRWMKPDLVSSRLLLEPGAGAGTRRWAEASGSSHLKNVTHLVDLVVRPPTRSQYEGDEIILESERRVRVVARSEWSLARSLIEALITFGPNGLPVHMEMQTATSVITLGPTYRRGPEGRWLVDKVDTRINSGGEVRTAVMKFEYQRVGPYTMPQRVTLDGLDEPVVQEYLDIHVDQGLTEEQIK